MMKDFRTKVTKKSARKKEAVKKSGHERGLGRFVRRLSFGTADVDIFS